MTIMIFVLPLVGVVVIPMVRSAWQPPELLVRQLGSPWRAGAGLVGANLLIIAVTIGLAAAAFSVPPLMVLPAFIGPALSFAAWTALGMAMPLAGARRWAVAGVGSAPYLAAAAGAWVWLSRVRALSLPESDPFMAWVGGVLLMVISLGAVLMGTLLVGLTRRK